MLASALFQICFKIRLVVSQIDKNDLDLKLLRLRGDTS